MSQAIVPFRLRQSVLIVAAAVCTGFSVAPAAYAQSCASEIVIPAQDLGTALDTLSSQCGVRLLYSPEAVKGKRAPAVQGKLGTEEALTQLLAGSGLTWSKSDDAYAIKAAAVVPTHDGTELPTVTITATRTERRVDEVPASVSVITSQDIATKNRQNVNDALRDVEGLDFVAQQGVGHQVFPTIRGVGGSFAGSTTQVLVDGIAHDSAFSSVMGHGGLNFTSLFDVERVEVLRGPASALYGPSTIGGVINVIPKRWKGDPGAEVAASYGSHDTQTLDAAAGLAKDNFDIRLSVHDAKSDGYKAVPVEDPNGEWDLGPRDWQDRKLSVMLGFRPADNQELTLNYQQYATRSAMYGGRPNDRQNMDGDSTTIGYRYDLSADTNIKANFRSTNLKQRYTFDGWDWNGLTTTGVVAPADLELADSGGRNSKSTFFQVVADTRPMTGNELVAGYSHDTGKYEMFGGSVTGAKGKTDALFIEDEHKFGALVLTGGARYDRIDQSADTVNGAPKNGDASVADVVNPRIGARYHLTDATSFYASYGTAYLPALNTFKFVQPSTTRVDNPNLDPEKSKTYEIGMNNRLGVGNLRTSIYHTDYKDKITLGTDAASGKRQWQNISVVKVEGIEIAFDGDLGGGWRPYANFSYTKARDYATPNAAGTQSMRVSPRKFNAGLTYAPSDAWSATLNARYVSGLYFNNLTEAQWADGYTQVDAKVAIKLPFIGKSWEGFVAGNNLTNKKYEPFNIGEWSDGRTFTIGVNGRF
ncbi:MAG TPA: TonB-dependent receptor [Rhodocyclaceae bacterium]|nr:TonB-dependent receptor [Rhodocyclaceae bacterium]